MTKKISRRLALEILAASALLPSVSVFGNPESDYCVFEYMSAGEVNSLRECLEAPKKTVQDKGLTITVSKTPDLLYHIKEGESLRVGLINILNKDGFFITANHIFDEFINKSKKKYEPFGNPIIIAYSHSFCFTYPARFLMNSKEDDLLLGKIDIPSQIDMKPIRIADENTNFPIGLYSLNYADMQYFQSDLIEKIIKSGEFSQDLDKKILLFSHNECIESGNKFNAILRPGIAYRNQNAEINQRCWDIFYGKGKRGDSGSPIFDYQGSLMGVTTDGVYDGNALCFTGPARVRKMIEHYISRAKKK